MVWEPSPEARAAIDALPSPWPYDDGDPIDAPPRTEPEPHTRALARLIHERFAWAHPAIGVSRTDALSPGGTRRNIHGSGRALDTMVNHAPQGATAAGDELANWLLVNWQSLGLQQLIWDNVYVRPHNDRAHRIGPYTPPDGRPSNATWRHEDHVHVEVLRTPGVALAPATDPSIARWVADLATDPTSIAPPAVAALMHDAVPREAHTDAFDEMRAAAARVEQEQAQAPARPSRSAPPLVVLGMLGAVALAARRR